ncbi:MAG: thioredoxin domain-containing protein [bacterium]
MKKVKFEIKGMDCQSCATLIEEKLKGTTGIIQAKVNHKSGKSVVIYDESVIGKTQIKNEMENAGEYEVSITEGGIEKTDDLEKEDSPTAIPNAKNNSFLSNLSVPISIIIAGLIIGGAVVVNGKINNVDQKNASAKQTAQVKDLPANSQPYSPPAGQPAAIQNFEITKSNHIRGDFNASITLVEFSDFECPFCERHYPTLNKILSNYEGKVRLVYKHFPLGFHKNSQKAAEASECASEQGKFWEYHDKLFENQPEGYSLDKFKKWASDLSLDNAKFNSCLDSGKYAQKVQDDYQEGLNKGVNGTPATFVNGQLVSGALPYESFEKIINSLLK